MAVFSIKQVLGRSWELMRSRFWFLVLLYLGIGSVLAVLSFAEQGLRENVPVLATIISIVSTILNLIVGMGSMQVLLQISKGNQGAVADLWEPLPQFFKFLGASILYGLMVFVGMLLLVVPGIICMVRFQFFGYLIVDKHMGPIEALKKSFAMTRGSSWNLVGLSLSLTVINIVGALCLILGLFVSIPLTSLAATLAYLTLLTAAETNPSQPSAA